MKILIVDDSISARFFLKSCITDKHTIYEAINGKEGLEKFLELKPDLIFMDITMPVMDGFEALVKIKEADPEAIVIVLTADIQKKTTQRILERGAFLFLKKPPKHEKIQQAIKQAETRLNVQDC